MAAGLGFKDFTTGEVLTAADVDGYLMQGIWVFANATARDAAVTSPQEGNSCYLKDTDVIQVYSGSSWVVKSGGSSPLTTKGDLYTYSTTDTRLGVGTNGQLLAANSSTATGLEWQTVSSGGMTLINTGGTTLTGNSVTISSIPNTYKMLKLIINNVYADTDNRALELRFNSDTGSNYNRGFIKVNNTSVSGDSYEALTTIRIVSNVGNGSGQLKRTFGSWDITNYTDTTAVYVTGTSYGIYQTIDPNSSFSNGVYDNSAAVSSLTLFLTGGSNFSGGTAFLYGVN